MSTRNCKKVTGNMKFELLAFTFAVMSVKMRRAQFVILLIVLGILLIPFLEQLDGKATFNRDFFDYFLAFLLLSSLGLGLELIIHKIQNRKRKILLIF